jgi:hypothetical protein
VRGEAVKSSHMIRRRFKTSTRSIETTDWIARRRKFIEKCFPETTNLLTTVMRMEARQ